MNEKVFILYDNHGNMDAIPLNEGEAMAEPDIYFYDISAVVVFVFLLLSILIRRQMHGPANRVFLSAVILAALTAAAGLGGDLYDALLGPLLSHHDAGIQSYPTLLRSSVQLLYFTLRTLTAPAYLVLISAISDTSHRLNNSNLARALLWTPMIVSTLFVMLNPVHHLVYTYDATGTHRGPLIGIIYASAIYYSLIGIWWLLRWRHVMSEDEFSTLMLLYPLIFMAVYIQFHFPHLRVEMFFTAIGLLMVSTFVLRPEYQLDSLVAAASLNAYHDLCHRCFATGKPLCLVYLEILDIDKLRELLGADELHSLVAGVSSRLSEQLSRGDVLYYLRNGLFCIVPNNPDADRALGIAQRTHDQHKARDAKSHPGRLSLVRIRSCVVRAPEDVSSPKELAIFVRRLSHLVPDSHATTYEALSRQPDFALNMALPSLLERAIRERSFQIYYQPIYCVTTGRFATAEALVRLQDPDFGWVPPSLFIPEAEQSGAIVQVGSILLDKICAFLGESDLDALGLDYVEVNLSVDQCIRPQLADELLNLVERHNVNPARINLEITETSSAFSQEAIETNVRTLADAGITFSLDDYGTGYSNVTRALQLPFSLVKFDKSFADALDDPSAHEVLERSIRMMASIGKHVLIEGVETAEQAAELTSMGVDYIQGYYYARPMPEEDFVKFLRAQ